MDKLSTSIKESQAMQRQLGQANLNLEAADCSNRALLVELDDARNALGKLRKEHAKCALASGRADKLAKELEDARQESIAMRKREESSSVLARRVGRRNEELTEQLRIKREEMEILSRRAAIETERDSEALQQARERLRMGVEAARSSNGNDDADRQSEIEAYHSMLQTLVQESESLKEENRYLKDMVEAKSEEATALRESHALRPRASSHQRSLSLATSSDVTSPTTASGPWAGQPPVRAASPLSLASGLGIDMAEPAPDRSLSDELQGLVSQDDAAATNEVAQSPMLLVSPPQRPVPLPSEQLSSVVASQADPNQVAVAPQRTPKAALLSTGRTLSPQPSGAGSSEEGAGRQSQAAAKILRRQPSLALSPRDRDTRTTQLSNLLDSVQRLFARLESADIDTLGRRLQRQHLTGDVGHLARTTVNAILRDVDGLRDSFRRLLDQEARNASRDEASSTSSKPDQAAESLLSRRDFFALIKAFKDLFVELGKLRTCINEIHLQPNHASKLLAEHLGLTRSRLKACFLVAHGSRRCGPVPPRR